MNLTIKTTWTKQRRIKHIWTVGRSNNDNTLVTLETIHFNQKLVQRLLTLIVTAAHTNTTVPTDCIDFINKDDTRRIFLRLLKHVTNTGRTHANKHFNKVRT